MLDANKVAAEGMSAFGTRWSGLFVKVSAGSSSSSSSSGRSAQWQSVTGDGRCPCSSGSKLEADRPRTEVNGRVYSVLSFLSCWSG